MGDNENVQTAVFEMEKLTKNCIRLQEVVDQMETPKIGTLYVQKHTLQKIGWTPEKLLVIKLEARDK